MARHDGELMTGLHLRLTPEMMLAVKLYQKRYNYKTIGDAVRAMIEHELEGEVKITPDMGVQKWSK